MNDYIDDGKDKKNEHEHEHEHLDDVTTQYSGKEEAWAGAVSEIAALDQGTVGDQDSGENDNATVQKTTVEPGPEISHFLRTEDHSASFDRDMVDSASVVHGVGHMLRNARMDKRMSVEDVSRQLRISVQQVEAIEREDFDELPGRTFVRGFVRNYANLLQLDSAAIVKLLPGPTTTVSHIEHTPFKVQEMTASSRDGKGMNSTLFTLVILLLLIVAGYFLYPKISFWQQTEQSSDSSVQLENGQASIELRLPLSSLKLSDETNKTASFGQNSLSTMGSASSMNIFGTITLNFAAQAHVRVTDGNDDVIFEQNNARGTQQRVSGKKPLSIVISDASAVEVTYNDRLIDIKPYTNAQNGSAQLMLE
ncbi:MAG: DUF4115 domain-containing protein [Nitrosomonas sp.]|nr:DUF4115 domain-containing protein [Nitrosomonas sp.]